MFQRTVTRRTLAIAMGLWLGIGLAFTSSVSAGGDPCSGDDGIPVPLRCMTGPEKPPMVRGFTEGIFLLSVIGGISLQPDGSFLDHERAYDNHIQQGVQLGLYSPLPGIGADTYFKAEYTAGSSAQLDAEYGLSKHVGIGVTFHGTSVATERQDIFVGTSETELFYEPWAREKNLIRTSSALLLLTYHVLERRALDPYVAVRAGGTSFRGEAHRSLTVERRIRNNSVRGGYGWVAGAGLGLNIFLRPWLGVKVEAGGYRHFLRAQNFSGVRTLDTHYFQMGVFMGLDGIAKL